jgi:hypothetical protein
VAPRHEEKKREEEAWRRWLSATSAEEGRREVSGTERFEAAFSIASIDLTFK